MKISLKQKLLDLIKENYPDKTSMEEFYNLCQIEFFKQSNAERRLRELTSVGLIQPVKNEKRYITGYKFLNPLPIRTIKFRTQRPVGEAMGVEVEERRCHFRKKLATGHLF